MSKTATTPAEQKLYNFLMSKAFKGHFLTDNKDQTIQRIETKLTPVS